MLKKYKMKTHFTVRIYRLACNLKAGQRLFFRKSLLCICAVFLSLSCTRQLTPRGDHDHVWKQGQDKGLHRVDNFRWTVKGTGEDPASQRVEWFQSPSLKLKDIAGLKAIQIKTVRQGEEVKNSITQSGAFIDPASNVSFIKSYYRLDYEVLNVKVSDKDTAESVKSNPQKLLAVLLKKVKKINGFPGTVYHILPRILGDYLVLYLVGKPDTIPYDQHFAALDLGELKAAPLVGYPIKYCVPEKFKTDFEEETDLNVAQCKGIPATAAEYVSLDTQERPFEYRPKYDLYPKDFFTGKWFYRRTVIRTSEREVTAVGHQPFEPADMVTFEKTSDGLKLVDAGGKELKAKDKKAASLLLEVDWKEYELDRDSDSFKTFGEREKTRKRDVERSHFKIKFEKLKLWGFSEEETEITHVFISDDYFSFNLEIHGKARTPVTVKIAFKKEKENPGYPQKQWFDKDSNGFFPVFLIKRKYYKDILAPDTQEETEKFYRVTRFDPSKEEIKWYFSKQSPEDPENQWVLDLGRQAIEVVNREFQEAGKHSDRKIRVTLAKDEERKELGDIRWNILNLIVTKSAQFGLLGYAPNVSHPITGEVLSATANVWVTNTLNKYVYTLKEYIRFSIYPPIWKWKPSYAGVSDFLDKTILNVCPEVKRFIERKYKGPLFDFHSQFHIKGEHFDEKEQAELLGKCAKNLAKPYIVQLLVHEIRHGLGFRHIFSGSADKNNYYTDYEEVKRIFGDNVLFEASGYPNTLPQSASLMDYLVADKPFLSFSGKCDIQATRFLYFDQVGLKNGPGFVDTSSGDKSILQAAEDQGIAVENVKQCHVCGGRPAADEDMDDLLCRRFDYGSSPKEVVDYHIETAYRRAHNTRRYDRGKDRPPGTPGIAKVAAELQAFGMEWQRLRNNLLESFAGRRDSSKRTSIWHYSSLISEDVNDYTEVIEKEAAENALFNSYYEIRQPIYDLFKELFFFPVKHCIYLKEEADYQAASLDVIITELEHGSEQSEQMEQAEQTGQKIKPRDIVRNCQSPVVTAWADKNEMGPLVTEVGYFGSGRPYFIKLKDEDVVDEETLFSAWRTTMDILAFRPAMTDPRHRKAITRQAFSILEEPDFRAEFFQSVTDYFTKGLDLNSYISGDDLSDVGILLDRVPSYKGASLVNPGPESMLSLRLIYALRLRFLIQVSIAESSPKVKQSLQDRFGRQPYLRDKLQATFNTGAVAANPAVELGLLMSNMNYQNIHPHLFTIYERYDEDIPADQQSPQSFISAVLNDPLTYSIDEDRVDRRVFLPHTGEGFIARIIRKLKEFGMCIERDDEGGEKCEYKEDKRAYKELLHREVFP